MLLRRGRQPEVNISHARKVKPNNLQWRKILSNINTGRRGRGGGAFHFRLPSMYPRSHVLKLPKYVFDRVVDYEPMSIIFKLGSLSTRVLETRTATRREHFAYQGSDVSWIFILIISNGEKILINVNVGYQQSEKFELVNPLKKTLKSK